MPVRKQWTPAKRRRARAKANLALWERWQVVAASRQRQDTQYAGLVPVVAYADQRLRLRPRLRSELAMTKGRNAVFTPLDEAMAYLGCQMAGILRLNHIDRLLPEGLLAQVLGLPRWPSENTEQRFLQRGTEATVAGLDRLLAQLVDQAEVGWVGGPIEVDGDVTGVPQRARKREGVQSGYCAGQVRPCYQQPRVTVNGLPVWTDLRRGRDGGSDVFARTLATAVGLARKCPWREVFCRVDGYYASKANLRQAQAAGQRQRNLLFLLPIHASDMKQGRWEELVTAGPGAWRRVNTTTEIRELGRVQPWGPGTPWVRAVAVRREDRKPARKPGAAKCYDLRYLIGTNALRSRLGTTKTFRRYHQRQREEFSFKDGKQSLSLAKMPTQKLLANRVHVRMVALAQLILQLFARRFLPHRGRYGPTCKSMREKVLAVGGKNPYREAAPGPAGHGVGAATDLLRLPLAAAPMP